VQPACTSHKWIRTAKVPDLAENPERIRAVLVGVAAAIANLEQEQSERKGETQNDAVKVKEEATVPGQRETTPDISSMLGGLSLGADNQTQQSTPSRPSDFLYLPSVSHPAGIADPTKRGKTLLNHPALQYVHSETPEAPFPPLVNGSMNGTPLPDSAHLRSLLRWCLEAPEKIRQGKVEIPSAYDGTEEGERLRLNANDLYLGPGSIDAIEGSVSLARYMHLFMMLIVVAQVLTVSQAVDLVCHSASLGPEEKSMQNGSRSEGDAVANKAFCVIRPPGHHCGQDAPSG
jgi:histone deacetylase HOS3